VAAALTAVACGAQAADMPDLPFLRGSMVDAPAARPNWQGFYVGGQAGYGVSDMNFTNATEGAVAKLLANTAIENQGGVSTWPLLGRKSVHGNGYGGFVGYNSQWDDVVIGIEANYMHGTFGGSDSDSMARAFSTNGVANVVNYQADASIKVKDIGSSRLRAGYIWNSFMPYAFGAISLGQADIVRTATISGTQNGVAFRPLTSSEIQNNHFLYGYGGGVGIDIMLTAGLFVRAEWEYLKFAAPIDTSVSTVRGGVGYKF
jgi:opacity protein-like surface antigen